MKFLLDENTKIGKIFNTIILILIVISLITFSISTLPNLSNMQKYILDIVETITVIIFTFEYILRIIYAEKKLKYIFSFYGLIDLLSILPFYLTTYFDFRSLRVFRLIRLFRIFKLTRYTDIIKKYKYALKEIKNDLILFFTITLMTIYISAVGIFYFENEAQPELFDSIFSSLWWAVITLTTVGYGDVYPITVGGKFFTFIILMIGLGIVAIPTGLIASSLTKKIEE